jgi:hypothetical protein
LLQARLLDLPDLLGNELLAPQIALQLCQRIGRNGLTFGCAQEFQALGRLLELGIEAADAEPRQGTPLMMVVYSLKIEGWHPPPRRSGSREVVGLGDAVDPVSCLLGLLVPAIEQVQQSLLAGLELLYRLAFDAGYQSDDEPALMAQLDHDD